MQNNLKFIALTSDLIQILKEWQYMISFMKAHPMSVLQLVHNIPNYLNHTDACGLGAGGICTSGLKFIKPIVWQVQWPPDIQQALVSDTNPKGSVTINDLELAGLVLGWLVLECQSHIHLAFHHIRMFCDNTSAVTIAA
jgi:hypothetical protein